MRNRPILLSALCLTAGLIAAPVLGAPGDAPANLGAPGGRLFSVADTNRDGFVDAVEWRAARDRIFERLDADNDGRLSRDEMQRNRAGRAAQRPGSDAQMERARQRRQNAFDRMDNDHDGFISRAEFAASSEQLFQRCDKNGDGKVARGECRGSGQRAAARPGRGGESVVPRCPGPGRPAAMTGPARTVRVRAGTATRAVVVRAPAREIRSSRPTGCRRTVPSFRP